MCDVHVGRNEQKTRSTFAEISFQVLRVLRDERLRAVMRRATGALEPIQGGRRCARCLRGLPEHMTVQALLDFAYYQPIRPWQVRSEIEQLAGIVEKYRPRTVLEIGTARGGTLFLWTRLAHPQATIISVDPPGGLFGGGYPVWLTSLYGRFALPSQRIRLIRADSHKLDTAGQVRSLLSEQPIDFLFIDGDHTYDGVRVDFEIYSVLVQKGGVVALHDVAQHHDRSGCDVSSFWDEIKRRHSHRELIADPAQGWAGIGVLHI